CGWRWREIKLSDRVFLCQNESCTLYQTKQDRDENAAKGIRKEALRLIGLVDQVALDSGSGGA
ncbi:MAG TPA: transposase, partial [Ktedonobacteraceae bacterium]|nr:transposase [Ktedonobacteraceae bacterium]